MSASLTKAIEAIALKICPFCRLGGAEVDCDAVVGWSVIHADCGARGSAFFSGDDAKDKIDAIHAWNGWTA